MSVGGQLSEVRAPTTWRLSWSSSGKPQALQAQTDEAGRLTRQLQAAQQQVAQAETARKQEALRSHKELERLRAVIAEHPAETERVVSERTRALEEEKNDLLRQIELLKTMVRSREVDKRAKAVDVQKLKHQLHSQQQHDQRGLQQTDERRAAAGFGARPRLGREPTEAIPVSRPDASGFIFHVK